MILRDKECYKSDENGAGRWTEQIGEDLWVE